ncbi:amino acid dehydrogenase [Aeromicrobium sp. A1-2]|uniref:NAD(P)/FAD-dependent oxidoreductase n=1 Tax=Aeromicrobium sp. A1-2 TaxID=2107713 RepID=UPI000E5394EF|nr:FAD-binding oxidoreductase [Aeromicrobium sp. A1-2]AXT85983.1 amino acid dehydrogenase [Aeromicrobium sp. A1-2]
MTSSPRHVVVIGAGMVGLSTAWHLQSDGVRVTVLDRSGVAAGSSWGNAGWLAPALTLPLPDPAILASGVRDTLKSSSPVYVPFSANPRLLRFLAGFARHCTPTKWHSAMSVYSQINRLGLAAFDELADGGVAEPTHEAQPFLAGFATEADRETLVAEFRHVVEAGGATDYDLLTGHEIKQLEPSLGDGVTSGLALHGQRFINPGRYVHSLAESVRARGGEIIGGVRVRDVKDLGSAGVEVLTDGASVHADTAVLATGAWLGDLGRRHGVKKIVQAGRGYSFTVQPTHMPKNPVYFPSQRVACTPLGDGFRVAGMMEFRSPEDPLDPRRVNAIIDAVRPMLTGVDWDARTDEWVGSRPCTADGLPLIGATRSPRVFVSGGHGMWGIVLGPLSGRLLAQQITRGERHPLMQSFDPLR